MSFWSWKRDASLHMGTHDELVHVPGTYRETALLQLMDLTERNVAASRQSAATPRNDRQRRSAETPATKTMSAPSSTKPQAAQPR